MRTVTNLLLLFDPELFYASGRLYYNRDSWRFCSRFASPLSRLFQVGSPPHTEITAHRFCVTSILAAYFTAVRLRVLFATTGVFALAEGASSRDHKNSHVFLRHQPVHSSLRSSYRSHNRFFPLPPSLYVYRQSYLTLNRATLMYATDRPSNFYPHEKAFLHLKKGHRRPRTLLRVVAVPTKQYIIFDTASHFLVTIAHRSNFHVAFKPEFLGAGSSSYQNNKQRNYQKLRRRQYLSRIELGLSRVAALGG